jgi:hypothetical protein
MRATHHFIAVFSLLRLNKKEKKFRETHKKYFWSFWFFEKKSKLKRRGKTKMRKTIYTGKLPTSKRRARKSFWVFSYIATN